MEVWVMVVPGSSLFLLDLQPEILSYPFQFYLLTNGFLVGRSSK